MLNRRFSIFYRTVLTLTLALSLSGCFEFLFPSSGSKIVPIDPTHLAPTQLLPDDETSLPISYLDGSGFLIAAPDEFNLIPVLAFADALNLNSESDFVDDNGDGYYDNVFLAVSTEATGLTAISDNTSTIGRFFQNARAENPAQQLCPIRTTNLIECFFDPQNQSPANLALALTDGNSNLLSEIITENLQANVFYVRDAQTDLVDAAGDLYTLTNGVGVRINTQENSSNNNFRVNGDYRNNYAAFESDGDQFLYQADNSVLILKNNVSGFSVLQGNNIIDLFQITSYQTGGQATEYTVFKPYEEIVYYAIAQNTSDEAFLYNLFEYEMSFFGMTSRNYNFTYNHIRFISPTNDNDALGRKLTHTRTLAFDINNDGYALVLYQDGENKIRLRASNSSNFLGARTRLQGFDINTFDFRDIQFFAEDRALLLDALNNRLWLIELDVAQNFVTQVLNAHVLVGQTPIQLVMNTAKTRAYVLNAGDESISVISLANSNGTPRTQPAVIATYPLTRALGGKNLTWSPNTLAVTEDSLFVGSQNLKAVIQIQLSEIIENHVADETQPESSDEIIEPECDTTETCDDQIDNNCNGQIDENCSDGIIWF